MPSSNPRITIYPSEETYKKFQILCDEENRSMSNQLVTMMKKKIKDYESENGSIAIQKNINVEDNHGTINM